MNIDCHYYGTYYIAKKAGFSDEDALQIAWAAQTVDECHVKNMGELTKMASDSSVLREFDSCFLLTILDTADDIRHTFSCNALIENTSMPSQIMLTAVRSIWMPFHFLPGNWRKALAFNQMEFYQGSDSDFLNIKNQHYGQNMHDWGLMCRTSSETCWQMIKNAKKQYHEWKGINDEIALSAVGIAMHVLADTWSHEFFVGSPNRLINFAVREKNAPLVHSMSTEDLVRISFSDYTYDALGHGPAGTAPDIPYLNEKYVLYHDFLSKYAESAKFKVRNNQKRFLNAFCQMLLALRYVISDDNPEADALARENFLDKYAEVKEELSNVQKLFDNVKTVTVQSLSKNTRDTYNEFVFPGPRESADKWQDLIHDEFKVRIKAYDLKEYGIYKIMNFMQAAKKHRASVLDFVTESTGWQDVFAFSSPSRDAPFDADECVRRFFNVMSTSNDKILSFYVPIKNES